MMTNQILGRAARHTFLLLALGLLAALLNATAPARAIALEQGGAPMALPRPAAAPSGAAAIFGLDDGGAIYPNQAALTLATNTGARWVRVALNWDTLEATQGVYDFTTADTVLNPLLAAGLSPMVFFTGNPAWAANTRCGPVDTKDPNLVAAFANVLGALAARYPDVKLWALYNEVDWDTDNPTHTNGGCFGARTAGGVNTNGVQDANEYAIMLAAAWQQVHAANPNALLASGAVAFDNFNTATAPAGYPGGGAGGVFNYNFTTALFQYMQAHPLPSGQKYMDMVLFNYYDIYGRYWETRAKGRGVQAKAAVLRQNMKNAGIPVTSLFVSETGEDSQNALVGLQGQARCLNRTMIRGAAAKLEGLVWWTFQDFPDSAPWPQNLWKYGVVDQNLQPKPSYTAFKTIASELNGLSYRKTLSNKTGFSSIEAYRFVGQGATKIVVWSSSIKSQSNKTECAWTRNTKLATFKAKRLRVVSYLGSVKLIKDNSKADKNKTVGQIAIKVGADPLIVQLNP
ncbi:MAG: hypothetical protein HY741_01860 [Chloroflexi bacterium]|nr:hypothetical protein [Chloroflexota bacterium]